MKSIKVGPNSLPRLAGGGGEKIDIPALNWQVNGASCTEPEYKFQFRKFRKFGLVAQSFYSSLKSPQIENVRKKIQKIFFFTKINSLIKVPVFRLPHASYPDAHTQKERALERDRWRFSFFDPETRPWQGTHTHTERKQGPEKRKKEETFDRVVVITFQPMTTGCRVAHAEGAASGGAGRRAKINTAACRQFLSSRSAAHLFSSSFFSFPLRRALSRRLAAVNWKSRESWPNTRKRCATRIWWPSP